MSTAEPPSPPTRRTPGRPGRDQGAARLASTAGSPSWWSSPASPAMVLAGQHSPRLWASDRGRRAGPHLAGHRAAGPDLGGPVLRPLRRHGAPARVLVGGAAHLAPQVSVRVRNFETNHLKVNDADGNPVEIAAIVVWQVAAGESTYAVDDYVDSSRCRPSPRCGTWPPAIRTTTPPGAGPRCGAHRRRGRRAGPRGGRRVFIAGVEIVEVRISHLAYARDRPGDAAPPAGQRGGGGPRPDRRRRGRHGRDGAQPAQRGRRGVARRGTQGQPWSAT